MDPKASKLSRALRGGIPQSALPPEDRAVAPPEVSLLAQRMTNAVRGDDVVFPYLGPAYIQLVGHAESNRIEGQVFEAMKAEGLPPIAIHSWSYDINRRARQLAAGARDPGDHSKPFGPLSEWLALDDDVLFACGEQYRILKERLDPAGSRALSEEESALIRDAFEKKDRILLMLSGAGTLATWLLSGDVQLTNSPTPASSDGEPSADG